MKILKALIFTILIFSSQFVLAQDDEIFKTIDFTKQDKSEDNALFYSLFLKTCGKTENDVQKKHWKRLNSKAQSVDINNDGINELIGFSSHYCSDDISFVNLYIFKKTKNGYKLIYTENIDGKKPIYIMNNKTSGYKDLKMHILDKRYLPYSEAPYIPCIAKYKKGTYHWQFDWEEINK